MISVRALNLGSVYLLGLLNIVCVCEWCFFFPGEKIYNLHHILKGSQQKDKSNC